MRCSFVLLALLACGDQATEPACSIRCEDGCPTGTTCSAGFCALEGATCEPEFERVEAGAGFACALDQFHRAWCWGSNANRQIEDSERTTIDRAIVAGDRRWDSITVGGGHACALDGNELWCWGRNDRNQVTGVVVGDVATPIRIEVDGTTVSWTAASAGYDYTCAIGDGDVYCWGAGEVGKLGGGGVNDSPRPQRITGTIHDWFDVAAGLRHTCALSRDSGVWCWGDGSAGQLGNDRFNVRLEPQAVALESAIEIAVGLETSCAITPEHELVCWGRAFHGALGDPGLVDPDGVNAPKPVVASTLGGWVDVAIAERYACGRLDTGDVYCWGTQIGGGSGTGLWRRVRTFDKVMVGASDLAVGWNGTDADVGRDEADLDLTCAIKDGDVLCWGDNRFGQLSQGGATRSDTPAAIGDAGQRFTAIVAGASHACASEADTMDVLCWGSVERGQVAGMAAGRTQPCTDTQCDVALPQRIETGLTGPHTLAAGAAHTCIHSGLAIACWGDSRSGQCGETIDGAVAPRVVAGQYMELFAGANAACGLDSTGNMICWGEALENHAPETDPELAGTHALAFGFDFGCRLDASQTLACFGNSANGAFGVGAAGTCGDGVCNNDETAATCADCGTAPLTTTNRAYQSIAIGRAGFTCGLRADGRVECWGENGGGQCGSFDFTVVTTPNVIANAAGCTQIAAGHNHVCGLCGESIVCWGDARHGEVGAPVGFDPVYDGRAIPPPAGSPWTSVTAGDHFTCGLTADGTGYCWGTSLHGALGNGARGANLPTPIRLSETP